MRVDITRSPTTIDTTHPTVTRNQWCCICQSCGTPLRYDPPRFCGLWKFQLENSIRSGPNFASGWLRSDRQPAVMCGIPQKRPWCDASRTIRRDSSGCNWSHLVSVDCSAAYRLLRPVTKVSLRARSLRGIVAFSIESESPVAVTPPRRGVLRNLPTLVSLQSKDAEADAGQLPKRKTQNGKRTPSLSIGDQVTVGPV